MINLGVVEGEYYYEAGQRYPNRRRVKWLKHIPRTAFSQGALYEVGSALTFFQVKNYADEFLKALDKGFFRQSRRAGSRRNCCKDCRGDTGVPRATSYSKSSAAA